MPRSIIRRGVSGGRRQGKRARTATRVVNPFITDHWNSLVLAYVRARRRAELEFEWLLFVPLEVAAQRAWPRGWVRELW